MIEVKITLCDIYHWWHGFDKHLKFWFDQSCNRVTFWPIRDNVVKPVPFSPLGNFSSTTKVFVLNLFWVFLIYSDNCLSSSILLYDTIIFSIFPTMHINHPRLKKLHTLKMIFLFTKFRNVIYKMWKINLLVSLTGVKTIFSSLELSNDSWLRGVNNRWRV